MARERSAAPARIAGWPAEVTTFSVGGAAIQLITVAGLESLLDREQLLRDDDVEPPYWALVWSGSRLVAEWLQAHVGCAGASVLDVGCGLGLIALTAAHGGGRVTAVDRDGDALEFVAASADLASVSVECVRGDVERVVAARSFDVVVAAELLYERSAFASLARTLAQALAPSGTLYLGDAFRVDTGDFYGELDTLGLECVEERIRFAYEEGTRVRIRLGAYRRRR